MSDRTAPDGTPARTAVPYAGVGVALGAGAGIVVGVLVGGAPAVALGAVLGGGLGVVVGAVLDGRRTGSGGAA